MELSDIGTLALPSRKICAAIGVFDGVHLGHRKIISALAEMARRHDAVPVALTFMPHPRAVLDSAHAPEPLTPPEQRVELLREAGAAAVGVLDFTPAFAAMTPEAFLAALLHANCGVEICGIAVGANWRFGTGGSGDADTIRRAAPRENFEFACITLLTRNGERVSSSMIREAERTGDLDAARRMLGRDCELYGRVGHDLGIGTELLAAPTANIAVSAGIPPPDGVYAGWLDGMPAAVNIGCSPSVAANRMRRRVEAHVIGRSVNLTGRDVKISLRQKIRDEIRFPDLKSLACAIAGDIEKTLQILESEK